MPVVGAAFRPRTADPRGRDLSHSAPLRRAIAALRAGRPVRITGAEPLTIAAVETTAPELLELVDPERKARLLISGERAEAMALANERDAADPAAPVLIERATWLNAATALAIADPGQD